MTTVEKTELKNWELLLESIMLSDTCAAASILSYYLDHVEDNGTIFCPLGYELYECIGHAMRADSAAFEASIQTGLMRSAIGTYVNAALDVWDNWDLMKNGVLYLMADPRLKMFFSCYHRVYVEALKDVEDEDAWCEVVDSLNQMINRTVPKGYSVS